MPLVGDVIMQFRELATDLPNILGPPFINSATQIVSTSGQFGISTVYFFATTIGQWGETLASPEQSLTITGSNNAIQINLTTFPFSNAVRIYYSVNVPGAESLYEQFTVPSQAGTTNPTVTIINVGLSGFSPQRNTAYNPDQDGPAVGAYAAYRWLNAALTWAASKNKGGIPSFGAIGTISGQGVQVFNGYWKKFDTAWYDGYPLYLARKNDVFRKAPVPGTVAALILHEATDRLVVEMWPQPSRTSAQTTLASGISINATTATLTNASAWKLGFGKAQIDQEIMEYSAINGNVLSGLVRGLAGTTAVAHNISAPVTELNMEISGLRMPASYSVGAAMSTLQAPPGWENALSRYMLYMFRSAEQDDAGANRYLKEAEAMFGELSANRIIIGPRQVSISAGRGAETYPSLGGVFGGVIVP
jgi:hypothetical protein